MSARHPTTKINMSELAAGAIKVAKLTAQLLVLKMFTRASRNSSYHLCLMNKQRKKNPMRISIPFIILAAISCLVCYASVTPAKAKNTADEIARLTTLLKSHDVFLRHQAVEKLASIKDRRVVDSLVMALRDHDVYIREYAAHALGQSALRDPKAVIPLIAILQDKDWSVRESAAEALGKIKDSRAVDPLIAALADKEQSRVRLAAADALVEIGMPAIEPLKKSLSHHDPRVRDAAAGVLKRIKPLPSIDALIMALGDKEPSVRWSAAKTLGEVRDVKVINPLIAAMNDNNFSVGEAAAEALNRLGWKPRTREEQARWAVLLWRWEEAERFMPEAVAPLINALTDDNFAVRQSAATSLGHLKDVRAIEPLLTLIMEDGIASVQKAAGEAYCALGSPAIDRLTLSLKEGNPDVRNNAARLLGEAKSMVAVGPLIEATRDSDVRVRASAAKALGQLNDPKAIEPLLALLNEKNYSSRTAAAVAVARFGEPGISLLMARLGSENQHVRFAAAHAILTVRKQHAVAMQTMRTILAEKNLPALAEYHRFFIRLGLKGSEQTLIDALNMHGNQEMCLNFLNSGNAKLQEAGYAWARNHHYTVFSLFGEADQPKWGEGP